MRELKGYTHITLVFGSCLLYIIYEHIIGRAERMTFIAVVYRKGAASSSLLSHSFQIFLLYPSTPHLPKYSSAGITHLTVYIECTFTKYVLLNICCYGVDHLSAICTCGGLTAYLPKYIKCNSTIKIPAIEDYERPNGLMHFS